MGAIPLLSREGEVEIAKRIEHGQKVILKALSRSPMVVREILNIGDQLKNKQISIRDVVSFSDDELTDERHMVDSPSHHPCNCRPVANHPHSCSHERGHQHADPHIERLGSGVWPRAYERGNRQKNGSPRQHNSQDSGD
jgi:hypothetical protein